MTKVCGHSDLTTVMCGGGLSGVITSDFFFHIAAADDGGRIGADTGEFHSS